MNKDVIPDEIIGSTEFCYGDPASPIAELQHTETKTFISVYKPINWFKRLILKWCFGLKYKKL